MRVNLKAAVMRSGFWETLLLHPMPEKRKDNREIAFGRED